MTPADQARLAEPAGEFVTRAMYDSLLTSLAELKEIHAAAQSGNAQTIGELRSRVAGLTAALQNMRGRRRRAPMMRDDLIDIITDVEHAMASPEQAADRILAHVRAAMREPTPDGSRRP